MLYLLEYVRMHGLLQIIMQALGSSFMNLEIKLKSHHCVPP